MVGAIAKIARVSREAVPLYENPPGALVSESSKNVVSNYNLEFISFIDSFRLPSAVPTADRRADCRWRSGHRLRSNRNT